MRVAFVGPPFSGKTTLFMAIAEAGGSGVHADRPDQPHRAVVKVPDERVDWLCEQYKPEKCTHAELELLDLPGFDLTGEAARQRARAHWPAVRNSDMIVLVLANFHNSAVPAYRDRLDYLADLDELRSEMLFSDLEQVMNRIEKLQAALKKPLPDREEKLRELALMERLQAALEEEKPLIEAVDSEAEKKAIRAFAFLTLKPALVVVNCDEGGVPADAAKEVGGLPAVFLSARIEEEIAALPAQERGAFLADMGIGEPAHDVLIRSCYRSMDLISFLTSGEDECRAWTVRAGTDAVTAAGEIHSDIARGFIRAEIISYDDLHAAGDEKGARAAGKFRLEGKTYIVRDGDVVHFRFSV